MGEVSFRVRRLVRMFILVVLKHLFETVKIEAVSDVVFINSGEESMIVKVTKPADPSVVFL